MGYSTSTRSRIFVCTVHIKNMINSGLTEEQYRDPQILASHFINAWENSGTNRKAAAAVCTTENNTYHMHLVLITNTTTLGYVAKTMWHSFTEPMKGSRQQLKKYLLKEGEFQEKGETVLYATGMEKLESRQGKRSDLEEIEDLINQGFTPKQIFEVSFKYRQYEKMIKSEYMQRVIKSTPLIKEMQNSWHFGSAGSGKTYAAYIKNIEKYSEEDVYLCVDYNNSSASGGGFDFYTDNPCKVLILDEFRGSSMPYSRLLSILDSYSRNQTHCRFKNTYNLWTICEITSTYGPDQIYKFMVDENQRTTDSFQQLIRRLNFITYHWKDEEGNYKEYTIPASEFISTEDMIAKALGKVSPDGFMEVSDEETPFN